MNYGKAQGRLTVKGWLLECLRRDAQGITGNLDLIFPDAGGDIFGKDKVEHLEDGYWRSWWPGEVRGNWMEGLVRLAFLLEDENLLKKARGIVSGILDNQAPDGYMGIYKEGSRYIVTKRFGELWTQSRIMRTLLVYYSNTKEEQVLEALKRMADNILANVTGSVFAVPDEDGSKGHSLMIIDGLSELYHLTGKTEYRDFCVRLYADYCDHPSQFIQDDLRTVNLLDPQVPFVGHGPHTCEMLRLPLLLYGMTGEKDYLDAFERAMEKLEKNLVLSGSCKSDEFIGTYQSTLVMENDDRASVFGGSVPLPSVGYEYCSTTELLFDYIQAEAILGDPSFADQMEWLVYNAGLASKHPRAKMIQYLGADNMYDASAAVNPRFDYSPTHDDAAGCCAANSARMMPSFIEQAFLQKEDLLLANLYLPVSLEMDGSGLTIWETTSYPFEYTVSFRFGGKGQTRFALRIPEYAEEFRLTVNGKPAEYRRDGQIAELIRPVRAGDRVALELLSQIQLRPACDGTYAVSYGTLLFSKAIPAVRKIRRKYAGARGFYDADFTPAPHENWDYTILTDGQGGFARASVQLPTEKGYPMDGNCLKIQVRALDRYAYPVDLVLTPIAVTTLRRTTFPVFHDQNHIYPESTTVPEQTEE